MFYGGRDSRRVTLSIIEAEGSGRIIRKFEKVFDYVYRVGNIEDVVNYIIQQYKTQHKVSLTQANVQVLTKHGQVVKNMQKINDTDVGFDNPRLTVIVTNRSYTQQEAIQAPVKIGSNDQKQISMQDSNKFIRIHCTERRADATERRYTWDWPYDNEKKLSDFKTELIKHYKDEMSISIPLSDIVIMDAAGNVLERNRQMNEIVSERMVSSGIIAFKVCVKLPPRMDDKPKYEGESEHKVEGNKQEDLRDAPTQSTNVTDGSSKDATERGRDDKSIDGVVQMQIDSDVQEIFATELGLKNDDMQRLLPLLASMGVHSMSGLVGASCEQIAALKLKAIPARKLQNLLEARRGGGSTPAVSSACPSTSGGGSTPAVPSVCPSTSGGGSTPAVPSVRPNIRNTAAICQNTIEVASHKNVCDNDEALLLVQFDLETKGAINTAFEQLIAQASVDELIALKKLVDCNDTMTQLIALKKLVDRTNTMKQLVELLKCTILSRLDRL